MDVDKYAIFINKRLKREMAIRVRRLSEYDATTKYLYMLARLAHRDTRTKKDS